MVNFKKILAVVTVICVFFLTPMTLRAETNVGVNPEQVAPPPAEGPNVFSQFAATIDGKTGDVLYNKNAHHRAFPASMTKVLTAILLMEHTKPEDQFTFSQLALDQEKSNYQIEFQPGETINRNTALMILMVLSANDVSYAIAERIGGNVENFAHMMNEKAKQLGATDSHFVTPNGLHDPNHYTTPYDMAMITRGVQKYPEILQAMNTKRTTVTTSSQTVSIFNKSNYFENPYSIGGKTGFTNEARNTLVLLNEKDGNRIINVVMASQRPEIYEDLKQMADYSFGQFVKQTVLDKHSWHQKATYLNKDIDSELEKSAELMLKKDEGKNVRTIFRAASLDKDSLYHKGIHRGEVVGAVDITKNNQTIATINVLSKEDVTFAMPKKDTATPEVNESNVKIISIGIGAALLFGAILFVVLRRNTTGMKSEEK
ncbi:MULTISPECIES: D-alanyl-D-alanine carboxypeptidase family protein [Bacillus cereus group]|uniref:serine-type D-Ala-D-Ala carboxypeptidase n=1 Tax=Bacillus thuringiensis TaxID=1428 RepID=A0A1C4BED0_BACTU|nr:MULTISPECIES: D-alanyl-D-alanine carboxypeptidase family protein [Bacillus cereus group]MCC2324941.1 D-alanyl-D-alanine carboxypeptidase [Bacillus wiedmannii]MDP1455473.1 D-alanyl-D-alanine carboxypeptidase family protein [Bacillus wiedmannii]MED2015537.1 D-alanyl-D-alanine carboxypeptidase [Bacillus wiedmannii]MED3023558.1 D-alanyl-D-alanine carboxypeptidase [Bacillus wiedmannii]OTX96785.1 D-alanyl-D-alanine carboxypeptidase [Bacillus thuringiensis serovar wratislaviensis]